MSAVPLPASSFHELLERSGATPPRSGRRKWRCGHCEGKSSTVSVHLGKGLAFCHRCHWKATRRTLERELGIPGARPDPAEIKQRRAARIETASFLEWVRVRRIEMAALLRELEQHEAVWREQGRADLVGGQPVSGCVWEKLETVAAWQEEVEMRYAVLCDVQNHFRQLHAEFYKNRIEAAA